MVLFCFFAASWSRSPKTYVTWETSFHELLQQLKQTELVNDETHALLNGLNTVKIHYHRHEEYWDLPLFTPTSLCVCEKKLSKFRIAIPGRTK